MVQRGLAFANIGEFKKAIADYSKALELDPKHTNAWHNRGIAHYRSYDYEKAVADHTKALELSPKFAPAWSRRGHAYVRLGKRAQARADFTKSLELDPKNAQIWHSRGLAQEHGDTEKQLADFNKALELDPTFAGAWHSRGFVYRQLAEYDKAITDFTTALVLEPRSALFMNARGEAYECKGEYEKAISDYAHTSNANHGALARVRLKLGQFDDALKDADKAVSRLPDLQEDYLIRALVYRYRKQWQLALDDYTYALKTGGSDEVTSELYLGRAHAYRGLGKLQEARDDANEAFEFAEAFLVRDENDHWSRYLMACVVGLRAQLRTSAEERAADLTLAFQHLKRAVDSGNITAEKLKTDADLEVLRADDRFKEITSKAK